MDVRLLTVVLCERLGRNAQGLLDCPTDQRLPSQGLDVLAGQSLGATPRENERSKAHVGFPTAMRRPS